MTLVDGPGGTLFPNQPTALTPQFEELMVERVREADSLVICIDSAKPQLAVFRKQFSALLERVGGKSRLGIPAKRVLVLLTKVDAAVAAAVQGAHRAHQQLQQDEWPTLALRVLRNNSITPYRLASLLSPFDFARATLDQATLSMIRRSLDSRAQMAIGVCSSTGFYSDGSVFWDDLRSEIYPRIAQGPDERLRNWTPFGIEEAIVFLASGRAFSTVNTYSAAQDWRASETRHRMRLRLKLSPTSR
jgi:hypothetical protein